MNGSRFAGLGSWASGGFGLAGLVALTTCGRSHLEISPGPTFDGPYLSHIESYTEVLVRPGGVPTSNPAVAFGAGRLWAAFEQERSLVVGWLDPDTNRLAGKSRIAIEWEHAYPELAGTERGAILMWLDSGASGSVWSVEISDAGTARSTGGGTSVPAIALPSSPTRRSLRTARRWRSPK